MKATRNGSERVPGGAATKSQRNSKNNHRENGEQDKHDRILNAAVKVFATHGFHKSKISQVAEEAGVADGTIYLYFKNKDDILISLFEENLTRIIENLKQDIEAEPDPVAKLRKFIMCHMNMMNENRNLGEVLTVELRQSHKFMREYTPTRFAEYLKVLSLIIREGKDAGLFGKSIHPGIAKRAIYGAIDELALNWVLSAKPKYDLETAAAHMADLFIGGMLSRPETDN